MHPEHNNHHKPKPDPEYIEDPVAVFVMELPVSTISQADKVAFVRLWAKSSRGRNVVEITGTELARLIGNSDGKSGSDRIDSLKKLKFIDVLKTALLGHRVTKYEIRLNDPRDLAGSNSTFETIRYEERLEQLELPGVSEPSVLRIPQDPQQHESPVSRESSPENSPDNSPENSPHGSMDFNHGSKVHGHETFPENPRENSPGLRRPDEIRKPWNRKADGVTDAELVLAVQLKDAAFLFRLYDEVVKVGWNRGKWPDCEDSKLRFFTLCHHCATAPDIRSRMGLLSTRVKASLNVAFTKAESDQWAAKVLGRAAALQREVAANPTTNAGPSAAIAKPSRDPSVEYEHKRREILSRGKSRGLSDDESEEIVRKELGPPPWESR